MKVLGIDQGTTGTKAFTLDDQGTFKAVSAFEHCQIYPKAGWVEHDPNELLGHLRNCAAIAGSVNAIGLANQGETVVAWDARTGTAIYNAIVWQDTRTGEKIAKLKAAGAEELTLAKAGLPLDPYFSAAKMRWILDHVAEAKTLLAQGRLRLGTSDAFFLDRLTGEFATDVTTASRTSLMSLDTLQWDGDLCGIFGVPIECLPKIRETTGPFGSIGDIPITASLVDQQAALFGHGCTKPGETKITFGTGAFALAIAGTRRPPKSQAGLSTTIAWACRNFPPQFALEGGVYNAASAVNWARSLGLFKDFDEIDGFPAPSAMSRGLVFVPALSGLACPHWDRKASGLWLGFGLETNKSDLMQSVLEGIAMRAAEVVRALATETSSSGTQISVDGGLTRNPYFVNFLAQACNRPVSVAGTPDLTGLGCARMAMAGLGRVELPPLPRPKQLLMPDQPLSAALHQRFAKAIERARDWKE